MMRCHLTTVRMAISKSTDRECWWWCGSGGLLHHRWERSLLQALWRTVRRFLTILSWLLCWSESRISWRCLCIIIVHWLWSFSRSFLDSRCCLSGPTAISLHAVGRYYLPEKLFCWRKRKLTNIEDAHVGSYILPKHRLFPLKWKVATRSFPRLLCIYLEDSYSIF